MYFNVRIISHEILIDDLPDNNRIIYFVLSKNWSWGTFREPFTPAYCPWHFTHYSQVKQIAHKIREILHYDYFCSIVKKSLMVCVVDQTCCYLFVESITCYSIKSRTENPLSYTEVIRFVRVGSSLCSMRFWKLLIMTRLYAALWDPLMVGLFYRVS